MTTWFCNTFLPSLFQRAGTNSGLWLSQKQTAICTENMTRHSVRYRDECGVSCTRLHFSCNWKGREVMMQYSKLNGCGMIFFGLDPAELQEQERKNQQERDENELKRLRRRFERHPEKFAEDMQDVIEEIADTESELKEQGISERNVIRCKQILSELRKTLAWMQEIKNQ